MMYNKFKIDDTKYGMILDFVVCNIIVSICNFNVNYEKFEYEYVYCKSFNVDICVNWTNWIKLILI